MEIETGKVNEALNTKYDKLKYLLSRVLEESKKQLERFEKSQIEFRTGMAEVNAKLNTVNEDLTKGMNDAENRVMERLSVETSRLEDQVTSNVRTLEELLQRVSDKQASDYGLLKETIEDQDERHNAKLDKLAELMETYHMNNYKNITTITNELDNHRKAFGVLDEELESRWDEVDEMITQVESQLVVLVNNEAITRREGEEKVLRLFEDRNGEVDEILHEMTTKIDKTQDYINSENQDLRRRIEKLGGNMEKLGVKVTNITETT